MIPPFTLQTLCLFIRCVSFFVSRSVMFDSLWPHGLYSPWNSPGQNTGVSCLFLPKGIFPTQGLNAGLRHCRWILYQLKHQFSSVQSLSRVQLSATPWIRAHQASLSITNSQSPPKPMSIESGMPSNHLILCRPLLLLPSIFPSIGVFSNESALPFRWPKYVGPSIEHPGLTSFRMVWLDLLAVQGTLKSLLQHHSSKASILQCSAFFIV